MLLKKSVLAFVLLNCLLQVNAQAPKFTGKFTPVLDDNINGFWEYLPRNYVVDAPKRYPLLIFIHGSGEQGSTPDMATLNLVLRNGPPKLIQAGTFPDSFSVNGSSYKFIVICPQIKVGLYGASSIIAPSTVQAVIQYAKNTYRVDTTRIYLTGLSMGGGATWDYAGSSLAAASKLAAVVISCAAADVSSGGAFNIAHANLPVLATHNWDDPLVAASRTLANVTSIIASNSNIHPIPRTVFWATGGHNAWSRTFEKLTAGSTQGGNVVDTLGMNIYNWMLQFNRLQLALPVSWQSISIQKRGSNIQINWVLSSQESVKEFQVQRSNDARNWSVVSVITPTRDNRNVQYSYSDNGVPPGKLYYRIVAVDLDGKQSYSPVKEISEGDNAVAIIAYPNPFVHQFALSLPAASGSTLTLRIADGNGKLIVSKQIVSTNHSMMIEESAILSAGLYWVSILSEGKQVYRQTIIKQ